MAAALWRKWFGSQHRENPLCLLRRSCQKLIHQPSLKKQKLGIRIWFHGIFAPHLLCVKQFKIAM
jgi:hypothetical protein